MCTVDQVENTSGEVSETKSQGQEHLDDFILTDHVRGDGVVTQ